MIIMTAFSQDIAGILLFSHDSGRLSGRMLLGATFLISSFYRRRYRISRQLSDLSEKRDQ